MMITYRGLHFHFAQRTHSSHRRRRRHCRQFESTETREDKNGKLIRHVVESNHDFKVAMKEGKSETNDDDY